MKFISPLFLFLIICNFCFAQCDSCQYYGEHIFNGDFENGNTGFTTSYEPGSGFICPLCDDGTYAVGANAFFYHYDFEGSDHTDPPFGNFMIINGMGSPGTNAWCQTININPGTEYTFSFWARDVTNNNDPHPLAKLVVSFNGIEQTDTLIAEGTWQQYSATYNSGMNSTVDICILNYQDQTGGNDFGLDDISLMGCRNYNIQNEVFAGNDQTICSGQSITLGELSETNYSYSWNNSIGLSNDEISNPELTLENNNENPLIQEYILTIDSAAVGCIQSDTVVITVLSYPVFDLGPDTYYCELSFVTLDAGIEVTWNNDLTANSIDVSQPGNYSAVAYNGPCISSDEISVNEILLPKADIPALVFECEGESIALDAFAEQNDFYEWSTGDSTSSILVSEENIYIVTASNECGEISDTTFADYELCGYGLFIPNAFTPNTDGVNEGWSVQGFNIAGITIFIYNRLGDLIFYSESLDDPWMPDYVMVGDDSYNYHITFSTNTGESGEKRGHIYLLK